MAEPWTVLLLCGLSLLRSVFIPSPLHVQLVFYQVALGQVSFFSGLSY
jgi:hypothetical protein